MAEITAAAVKSLREKTGLPMMDCKQALSEAGGDEANGHRVAAQAGHQDPGDAARSRNRRRPDRRLRRSWQESRRDGRAAMRERPGRRQRRLQAAGQRPGQAACATAPAPRPATSCSSSLRPRSPARRSHEVKDDLFNRIREVFNVGRIVRIDAPCGGYAHHAGSIAALVEVEGGNAEAAKDVAMHIAARTQAPSPRRTSIRRWSTRSARSSPRPLARKASRRTSSHKMIEGRLRNFYAERVLLEQPFVKDDKKTVGQYAKEAGMQVKQFVRWELGKTTEA